MVPQEGLKPFPLPGPLFQTSRVQLDPSVTSGGPIQAEVNSEKASHPAVVPSGPLSEGNQGSIDQVNIQFVTTQVSKATWGVVEHVEKFGCSDTALKLRILDLKTRFVELEKAGESGSQTTTTRALHEGIRRLQKEVVKYGAENNGEAIGLKFKIMDLSTRLCYLAVFTNNLNSQD